ncbi:MAG: hypothetical protein DRJ03_03860 [Chloroflexi bacterium]|nr:MAG: hypothetical protein B6I35_01585 [Anaerolineaceae bacterium 4572_32.2]RLC81339.1 MAG: hypothetical protein DRI81_02665 [Chloroflexota bacterium]RLC88088.1 MAG: hypothetical protein DRJ03_03860 [Chloroflexota bacterium]HEY72696.1 segregation/condensation protein A [Thermoflexia bacterium]
MSLDYQIRLSVFEGPLDLLLQLIEREEFDVTTVALARVTDQYLAYLEELERREVKELADFLVVAAKLLLIKSLALLSRPSEMTLEAEEVGNELVQQLQVYVRFKKVAALLHEREREGLHSYLRIAPLPHIEPQLDLGGVTFLDLIPLVQEALDATPAPPVGEIVTSPLVTITEQIVLIERRLTRQHRICFREVLSAAATRVEVIVTLLAVLELIKQHQVQVRQERLFGEIVIERQSPVEPSSADVAAAAPAA